jgi:hypothetical protein
MALTEAELITLPIGTVVSVDGYPNKYFKVSKSKYRGYAFFRGKHRPRAKAKMFHSDAVTLCGDPLVEVSAIKLKLTPSARMHAKLAAKGIVL